MTINLIQRKMLLSKAGPIKDGLPSSGIRIPVFVFLWEEVGLAIHKSMFTIDNGAWIVSHFNSGRSVVKYIKTKEQAIKYLQGLYDILEDWTFTEEEWNEQTNETKYELKIRIEELQDKLITSGFKIK